MNDTMKMFKRALKPSLILLPYKSTGFLPPEDAAAEWSLAAREDPAR